MAIKFLLLTVVLAGIVNGQFDDDDDEGYEGFGPNEMYIVPALTLPTPPRLPNIPGLPQPPPLPTAPPLLMFGPRRSHFPSFRHRFPRPEFPETEFPESESPESEFSEPEFPEPEFPTVEEIASEKPQPGGTFDAVFISSKSKALRTKDGKILRKGGSTVLLNDNGKVTLEKMGDSPPEVIITKEPPFADFPLKFKHLKPHFGGIHHFGGLKPPKPFDPFGFKHFDHKLPKPFDLDKMKNFVPKDGANFVGTSSSTSSHSSTVNGITTSGGSASLLINDNGDVDEKKLAFEKSDAEP